MIENEIKCPDCGVDRGFKASTLPGFVRCACGQVFPAADKRERIDAEAEAPKEFIVPDKIAVEYGWRGWGIRHKETDAGLTLLESVTHKVNGEPVFWRPFVPMQAVCNMGCTDVPSEGCRCGLYCAKTLEHLLTMPEYYRYNPAKGFTVIGKVALWGGVIEGRQGWKAEFGYPSELYLPFEAWHLHNDLKESYGVPIYLKNFMRGKE